jgi:hypothetical protein
MKLTGLASRLFETQRPCWRPGNLAERSAVPYAVRSIVEAYIAIALLISTLGLYGMWRYRRAARNSEDWPCLPGKLLNCEVVERLTPEGAKVYNLDVKYSYDIDGEVRESNKVMFYFAEWSTGRSNYVKLQDALVRTNSLTVYVNPHDPGESVLFPGAGHVPAWILVTAAIMILVCPISGAVAVYVLFFS